MTMQYRLLLLLALCLLGHHAILTSACFEIERESLLTFKAGIIDTSNRLSSWAGRDCCSWQGVVCDNNTGHVVKLNLQNNYIYANWSDYSLRGEINPSLLVLTHLSRLDLSWNDFGGISIPKFIGSLKSLMHLDLSASNFSGKIPEKLDNLSNLRYLDLSYLNFICTTPPQLNNLSRLHTFYMVEAFSSYSPCVDNLSWLSQLSSIRVLNLSWVNLSNATDWLDVVNTMHFLTELSFSGCRLTNISTSFSHVNFTSLKFLDLSFNGPFKTTLPPWLWNLTKLSYLDLRSCEFHGKIPKQLGNLSNLRYLDLSFSNFICTTPPRLNNLSRLHTFYMVEAFGNSYIPCFDNLSWLSQLSSIRVLDLSGVNLSNATDLLEVVNTLHLLTELYLSECSLTNIPTSLSHVNFTSLKFLDLSDNGPFNTTLPTWLWNLTKLSYLDLGYSGFHGKISDSLGNLTSLNTLHLDGNDFEGSMPRSIQNLCNLVRIDLSYANIGGDIAELVGLLHCSRKNMEVLMLGNNKLHGGLFGWLEEMKNLSFLDLKNNSLVGHVPPEIGKLSNLQWLDLSHNSLNGVIYEAHFANLSKLNILSLGSNSLIIDVDKNWVPLFQLSSLVLDSCQFLQPQFPAWLRSQMHLVELYLSNTSIADTIPEWFWNLSSFYIDLSHNQIRGELPMSLQFTILEKLILRSNRLEGPIPSLPNTLETLDLSENSISGPLSPITNMSQLYYLTLSSNQINGSISSYICKLKFLYVLDLSNNSLSGELTQCWKNSSFLVLDLSNNNLAGEIPSSIGSLSSLTLLHLNNNNFYGELPSELQHCNNLLFLDLSNNKFTGEIPTWIGENLQDLVVLQLRSNMFTGEIPSELARLVYLQFLDLAHNNLTGSIPRSFGNFSAMFYDAIHNYDRNGFTVNYKQTSTFLDYSNNLLVVIQGEEYQYSTTIYLLKIIDLSENNLSGQIPEEIVALVLLRSLNLSRNHLTGTIPERLGDMRSLESLDLSLNELQGAIPQSLSALTFLSCLNLSYNNLSGRIPTGNQLSTLNNPSIYIGNTYLCGPPTEKNCSKTIPNVVGDNYDGSKSTWPYLSMGLGFVAGFWSVCGILIFKETWSSAYFQMIDRLYDKIYVIIAINMRRLSRKMHK